MVYPWTRRPEGVQFRRPPHLARPQHLWNRPQTRAPDTWAWLNCRAAQIHRWRVSDRTDAQLVENKRVFWGAHKKRNMIKEIGGKKKQSELREMLHGIVDCPRREYFLIKNASDCTRLLVTVGIVIATVWVQPEINENKVSHIRGNLTFHNYGIAANNIFIVSFRFIGLNDNWCKKEN